MSLNDILNDQEKHVLQKKLHKLSIWNLELLCYRLCTDKIKEMGRMNKEVYISMLMIYGLRNPDAPNYLPCPEEF